MHTRTQEKGAVTPQETKPDLPVSVRSLRWRCGSTVACCRVGVTECHSGSKGPFREVAIIFITSTIVWPQVKQQEQNTASPINRKLDKRFTEHSPAHQNKIQFHPQSVSPIRKPPQASYLSSEEDRQNENHNHRRKLTSVITWIIALSNSMKL